MEISGEQPLSRLPGETLYQDIPVAMTIEQAAKMLEIGRTTAFALVRNKELRTIKVRGALRITRRAMLEFLEKE